MGTFIIRSGIAAVVLAILWLFAARSLSLLVDHVFTVVLVNLPSTPIGWNGSYLQFGAGVEGVIGPKGWNGAEIQIGAHILGLEGPGPGYRQVVSLEVDADERLVVFTGGRSLVLGSRAGTVLGGDGGIPAFAADRGDKISVSLERSWLGWPTPFELNFMTGQSPSWRRHLYYRLSWEKASGARLDMVWRFEQGFDRINGWGAPGQRDDTTGLISAEISPAPPPSSRE